MPISPLAPQISRMGPMSAWLMPLLSRTRVMKV
jgi:hypothetical protein